ncbi:MAG: HD domain-containing protein [Patescibacteria group bacterium]
MIPTEAQCQALWEKYNLPENKRRHVTHVAEVAKFLAQRLRTKSLELKTDLLIAGALLHDIDKNAPKVAGEQHPAAAVRILKEEGMEEVASLIKTHPLHAILDPAIVPKTWEEKILFLADKMVKYEIMTVDKRFALWQAEHLPPREQVILAASYPRVKELEKEIFEIIGLKPEVVRQLVTK